MLIAYCICLGIARSIKSREPSLALLAVHFYFLSRIAKILENSFTTRGEGKSGSARATGYLLSARGSLARRNSSTTRVILHIIMHARRCRAYDSIGDSRPRPGLRLERIPGVPRAKTTANAPSLDSILDAPLIANARLSAETARTTRDASSIYSAFRAWQDKGTREEEEEEGGEGGYRRPAGGILNISQASANLSRKGGRALAQIWNVIEDVYNFDERFPEIYWISEGRVTTRGAVIRLRERTFGVDYDARARVLPPRQSYSERDLPSLFFFPPISSLFSFAFFTSPSTHSK